MDTSEFPRPLGYDIEVKDTLIAEALHLHSAERSVHRCVLERPPCGAKRPPV